jgi:hypothetical protein
MLGIIRLQPAISIWYLYDVAGCQQLKQAIAPASLSLFFVFFRFSSPPFR